MDCFVRKCKNYAKRLALCILGVTRAVPCRRQNCDHPGCRLLRFLPVAARPVAAASAAGLRGGASTEHIFLIFLLPEAGPHGSRRDMTGCCTSSGEGVPGRAFAIRYAIKLLRRPFRRQCNTHFGGWVCETARAFSGLSGRTSKERLLVIGLQNSYDVVFAWLSGIVADQPFSFHSSLGQGGDCFPGHVIGA